MSGLGTDVMELVALLIDLHIASRAEEVYILHIASRAEEVYILVFLGRVNYTLLLLNTQRGFYYIQGRKLIIVLKAGK